MSKSMLLVLVVLSLTVVGCHPAGTWRVAPELQQAAYAASDMWCDATDGVYCPVVDDPNGDRINLVSVESVPVGSCGQYESTHNVYGDTRTQHINIVDTRGQLRDYGSAADGTPLCARLLPDGSWSDVELAWSVVIAHELGHAIGLPDLPLPGEGTGTIMGSDLTVLEPSDLDADNATFVLQH